MVGKVSWKDELDGSLDVGGGKSDLLLVSGELGGLNSDSLEDIVDERVHDSHTLLGDSDVTVDVLENSVDVDRVRIELLLVGSLDGSLFSRCSSGHF